MLGCHLAPTLRPCPEANLFFLPPYSPDFNSIAQVFAKLKTLLRKPPNLGGGNPCLSGLAPWSSRRSAGGKGPCAA